MIFAVHAASEGEARAGGARTLECKDKVPTHARITENSDGFITKISGE